MSDRKPMLTPEQIKYVREWAASGNEERVTLIVPKWLRQSGLVWSRVREDMYSHYHLNSAGLTIAALADAFEQACETAEEYSEETGWQPIDTAPRDGAEVLLLFSSGRVESGSDLGTPAEESFGLHNTGPVPEFDPEDQEWATHWMPIPPLPETKP